MTILESRDSRECQNLDFGTILSSFFRDPLMGGSYIVTIFALPTGFQGAYNYGAAIFEYKGYVGIPIFAALNYVSHGVSRELQLRK